MCMLQILRAIYRSNETDIVGEGEGPHSDKIQCSIPRLSASYSSKDKRGRGSDDNKFAPI